MKNVVKFNYHNLKPVVFCILDRLSLCQDNFTKEITKNQADYTISNIVGKGFNVYQGTDEYQLLVSSLLDGYEYAVIISTGTEFVNGDLFFQKLKNLITTDFFICGHILDRNDAYYELHEQCYIINLKKFKELGMPSIGDYKLNSPHVETMPIRSLENYHDEYTPVSVKSGKDKKQYLHKCHGWYILKTAFEYNMKLVVFDEEFRTSKIHYYPESRVDFLKHLNLIYAKESNCAHNFVHISNTEISTFTRYYDQLVIPASGTLYLDLIKSGNVIVYDYNDNSLDYWKEHLPRKPEIEYSFIKVDLLSKNNLIDYLQPYKKTLINLSNIFAYEGTSTLKPLYYRLYKENELITQLQDKIQDIDISFSLRAASGFIKIPYYVGDRKVIKPINIENLKRPTWHDDADWSTKPLQY